jgi:hypothetical protein
VDCVLWRCVDVSLFSHWSCVDAFQLGRLKIKGKQFAVVTSITGKRKNNKKGGVTFYTDRSPERMSDVSMSVENLEILEKKEAKKLLKSY